jgi:hypothetical protein
MTAVIALCRVGLSAQESNHVRRAAIFQDGKLCKNRPALPVANGERIPRRLSRPGIVGHGLAPRSRSAHGPSS